MTGTLVTEVGEHPMRRRRWWPRELAPGPNCGEASREPRLVDFPKVWGFTNRFPFLVSLQFLAELGKMNENNDRRKFRSQTSDNMDRWKAEQGRGREKRKIRREKIRRERVRGQKRQMCEKVGKSRNTVFFQWFVAPEGRKVGSLKRRVRSQLATGAMKNCTPLWREAHFEVKMYKTHQVRTTFGSWDVEKVHAVVARSTFWSQNVQNTPWSDHFWKLWCRKKKTPLWREAHFQVKSVQNWRSRTTFGGSDVEKVSKKCAPLWHEAHFEVKSVKKLRVLSLFWREDVEKVDTD